MKSSRSLFAPCDNPSASLETDVSVSDARRTSSAVIATTLLAIALLSGCAMTARWEPAPQTEALPQVAKHPVHAGVYYSPQFEKHEQTRTSGGIVFAVPIGSASVQLFDNVLPRVFENVARVGFRRYFGHRNLPRGLYATVHFSSP